MKAATRTLAAIAGILLGSSVLAHHAHPDFLDRDATVQGTIDAIQFQNPHVLLRVRTADEGVYTVVWQGANWLAKHPELVRPKQEPVDAMTLKYGDRIVIIGAPPRDASLRMLVNLKEVRRPHDGWTWKAQ
jgi:hypothetical protein